MDKPQPPSVTQTISGYLLDWQEEHVQVEVTRLRNHSDRVTGEVTVTTSLDGFGPLLHRGLFNFLAVRAESDLIGKLYRRCDQAPWEGILEQMRDAILTEARSGEPVMELMTGPGAKPPEYILRPFLIRNYPTVIFGGPSGAKSTFATILATTLLLPWTENPLSLVAPSKPTRCLYLDWETDEHTVQWQATRFIKGMGLPDIPISYRHHSGPLADDIEQLQFHVQHMGIEVVIIDSLGPACGGKELERADPALTFFPALRKLKVTSLILAHTSKANEDGKAKSIYGSTFFTAQARSVWEAVKTQDPGEEEMDLVLYHRKPPPFQKLSPALGYHFEFAEDAMTVYSQSPKKVADYTKHLGTGAQICALLKDGPLSTAEIMEELKLTRGSADMATKRLHDKGKVARHQSGKWCLPTLWTPEYSG